MLELLRKRKQDKTDIKFAEDYSIILDDFVSVTSGLVFSNSSGTLDVEHMLSHVLGLVRKKKYADKVMTLLRGIYASDNDTFVHSMNVALICHELSVWLGLSSSEQEVATLAGLLHDIGKLEVPIDVLQKPGPLTLEERKIIEKHTVLGFQILLQSQQNIDSHVCNAALMHHECFDGSGYPNGLTGSYIDKFARIVAVADVYDAMTAKRIYRQAMEPLDVIQHMKAKQNRFDASTLSCFVEHVEELFE